MKFIVYTSILSLGLLKFVNACGGPYAQCGGNNFSGESCCESGYECVALNEWYSQCQPSDSAPVSSAADNNVDNNNNNNNDWNNNNVDNNNNNNDWTNNNVDNNNNNNNDWNNNNVDNNNNNNNNSNNKQITASTENFFQNEIYKNPRFIEEVDSSIPKLSADLQAKAEKVKDVPTAVWLAWEGAPDEVAQHLEAANGKTVVFILYMIPTRDCNSNASAGGASNLEKYKGYVDNISNTIRSYPNTKVVMVVEPDTLGNLVTGESESCKNVHTLHKNALAYAADVFGSMSNVSVYLDAAHGMWLSEYADQAAAIIKEVLDKVPNGKIRGFSTNVSNYQPLYAEYEYHQKLNAALEALGITGMRFIVDTGRNGVDVYETFGKTKTWCNFIGTGLGERPKATPDSSNPLLDAFMWLKTPGEADGSSTGSRADPVCAREDSLPGAPDAGSWFHDYFAQLLQNANPTF
eukprot:jgi/Orpsp1_1/1192366/evm.model.d7180000092652.1